EGFPTVGLADQIRPTGPSLVIYKVEDLHRGLLVREVSSMTDRPAEPGVQALDRVGRVDDLAELDRELEERHELAPGVLPRTDHRRIDLPPSDRELCESDLGGFDGRGGVDLSQLAGDLTPVFLRRVT